MTRPAALVDHCARGLGGHGDSSWHRQHYLHLNCHQQTAGRAAKESAADRVGASDGFRILLLCFIATIATWRLRCFSCNRFHREVSAWLAIGS